MSLCCISSQQQERELLTGGLLLDAEHDRFSPGEILFENGIILAVGAIGSLPREGTTVTDVGGALISPGLVDIHTHGRAGGDFTDADLPTLLQMSRSYLDAGVTTVIPTLASAPMEDYFAAAERLHRTSEQCDGARFLGIHLEGRYLNPAKRGAHARELLAPLDAAELTALYRRMCRCAGNADELPFRLSSAFELDTDGAFLKEALTLGLRPSLAHTEADYETAVSLIDAGVGCFTHLFNAMPALHHRGGGAIAACLDSDAYGEIICDGFHIAPHMVRLAWRLLRQDRTVLITDSMMGAGCPDGRYAIAGLEVDVRDGKAYTVEGAIAGSTLGLLDGVCNLMCYTDASAAEALLCATRNPARAAGIDHLVGSLSPGLCADLLVLRQNAGRLTPEAIYVGGLRKGGFRA